MALKRFSDPNLGLAPVAAGSADTGTPVIERARRALVVGAEADVARVAAHPAADDGHVVIVGVQRITDSGDAPPEIDIDAALQLVDETDAGVIIVAGDVGRTVLRALADLALIRDCRLLTLMPSDVLPEYRPVLVWEGEAPLIQLAQLPRGPWTRSIKRTVDVVAAAAGLLVAAPVLGLLGLLIKIESPGPAIFRHRRVGRQRRSFDCLKLRTMRHDAEAMLRTDATLHAAYRDNHYKIPDDVDPRVTRLGRFLRRTSLDELPQLWNVLVGDMSLVGPRPVVDAELEHYRGVEQVLLSVRPGLTGAWAANGRHHVGYPQRAALELRYVRSWTLRGDVLILIKTVRALADYDSGPLA
jgi:lipopolysaccharide/colanic/teichoic acid biosynthesis glycosyltransferase